MTLEKRRSGSLPAHRIVVSSDGVHYLIFKGAANRNVGGTNHKGGTTVERAGARISFSGCPWPKFPSDPVPGELIIAATIRFSTLSGNIRNARSHPPKIGRAFV